MKLLFNEQHGTTNFFWYQTGAETLSDLEGKIKEISLCVNEDIKMETCYYFYTNIINTDALNDNVRTAIYVQKKLNGDINMNFNIADSQMAMVMDRIVKIKNELYTLIKR